MKKIIPLLLLLFQCLTIQAVSVVFRFDDYQLVSDLKKELPQLTLGYDEIVGHSEELSPYMLGMVNDAEWVNGV